MQAYGPILDMNNHMLRGECLADLLDSFSRVLARHLQTRMAALYLRSGDKLNLARLPRSGKGVSEIEDDAMERAEKLLAEAGKGLMENGGYLTWPGLRAVSYEPATAVCIPLQVSDSLYGMAVFSHWRDYLTLARRDIELLWILCSMLAKRVESSGASAVEDMVRVE